MKESSISCATIVDALSRTEPYPHNPPEIEARQTHISCAFLAGPFVYKIKKPVRFAFLDYSTLDKRRHFCNEEVRLNQRLAPDVYLGVVAIFERDGRLIVGEGSSIPQTDRIVEHAVKMRRLPEEKMLDRLVMSRQVGTEEIGRLAQKLVSFHQRAATERAPLYGRAEAVWQKWSENFRETTPFVDREISAQEYDVIRDYTRGFFEEHKALFEARVHRGRVCEGHGDLRAEHVCMSDGIIVFDCIEFNEGFRYCDVSSELAFLAMDLDFLGEPLFGEHLVRTYEGLSRDKVLPLLLPFYKSYRAYVRGKVECLKSQEQEVPEAEREKAKAQARRHFALAYRYAKGRPAPALIIVCGLPGTGKSTLAQIIRDRTGFALLSSDVTRKRLAGKQATARAREGFHEGIYSEAFTERTYGALLKSAEESLKKQEGVIVDATFKDAKHRRLFIALAERLATRPIFIECQAEETQVLHRLDRRQDEPGSESDATRKIYLRLRDEFMALSDIPNDRHIVVQTDVDPNAALNQLDRFLYRSV